MSTECRKISCKPICRTSGGKFILRNSRISNTYDDVMNIHGFYTEIQDVLSENKVRIAHLHPSHWGLVQYLPGDTVFFSALVTHDEVGSAAVSEVSYDDDRQNIQLMFRDNSPLKEHLLMENRTRMSEVLMEDNEIKNCSHVTTTDVTALGASDAIHLRHGSHMLIERCIFRTGDDCIAGANVRDLHVNNCVLNTSCNVFRPGGCDILIENCHICGPGYYPHRMTVVKSKDEILPREAGRHNTLSLFIFFASENFPAPVHAHSIILRNLTVENVRWLLQYYADSRHHFQYGDRLRDITFDNRRIVGLEQKAVINTPDDEPLTVRVRDVSVEYCDPDPGTELFAAESQNLVLEKF